MLHPRNVIDSDKTWTNAVKRIFWLFEIPSFFQGEYCTWVSQQFSKFSFGPKYLKIPNFWSKQKNWTIVGKQRSDWRNQNFIEFLLLLVARMDFISLYHRCHGFFREFRDNSGDSQEISSSTVPWAGRTVLRVLRIVTKLSEDSLASVVERDEVHSSH